MFVRLHVQVPAPLRLHLLSKAAIFVVGTPANSHPYWVKGSSFPTPLYDLAHPLGSAGTQYSRTREHAGSTRQPHPRLAEVEQTGSPPSAFVRRESHIWFEQEPAYASSLSLALMAIAFAHSHPNTTTTTYDKSISQRGGQQAPYRVDARRDRGPSSSSER
ncbi:hypothetical protein C8Q76DRAFT_803958 [Earliella scabrosa]|nr:hypothetical protein C8Q76DRAFT_803958 [Earliella scabrosa]